MEHTNEMTACRNRAFVKRCREVAEQEKMAGKRPTLKQIVHMSLYGGAPTYYVGYNHVYDVLTRSARRRRLKAAMADGHGSPAYCQLAEIARRCEEHMERHGGCSLSEALEHVLTTARASRFFMTERYALRLLRQHTRTVTENHIEAV